MFVRLADLKEKQVVCVKDGVILGFVNDCEIDTGTGRLVSLVIYGKKRVFGLFGRDNDHRVPWECIDVIGEDSILVTYDSGVSPSRRSKGLLPGFLNFK